MLNGLRIIGNRFEKVHSINYLLSTGIIMPILPFMRWINHKFSLPILSFKSRGQV